MCPHVCVISPRDCALLSPHAYTGSWLWRRNQKITDSNYTTVLSTWFTLLSVLSSSVRALPSGSVPERYPGEPPPQLPPLRSAPQVGLQARRVLQGDAPAAGIRGGLHSQRSSHICQRPLEGKYCRLPTPLLFPSFFSNLCRLYICVKRCVCVWLWQYSMILPVIECAR